MRAALRQKYWRFRVPVNNYWGGRRRPPAPASSPDAREPARRVILVLLFYIFTLTDSKNIIVNEKGVQWKL